MQERWDKLGPSLQGVLRKAGVTGPEQLAAVTNAELRAIPGIGPSRRKRIRTLFKAPATAMALEVPAHGRGALRRGGPTKEGPTTREFRKKASTIVYPLLERLAKVATDRMGKACECCGRGKVEVPIETQVRAIDVLAKYGPGTQREVVHALDREKAKELIRALATGVQKHVLDEAIQEAIAGEWETAFFAFFPRQ